MQRALAQVRWRLLPREEDSDGEWPSRRRAAEKCAAEEAGREMEPESGWPYERGVLAGSVSGQRPAEVMAASREAVKSSLKSREAGPCRVGANMSDAW